MSFDYHLSQWSKKPAVWVGGVVLTAAIIYAALDDPSPRRGYSVFPSYVPETSPIRPRGGLAPGSAYSEGGDSLAMAGGMSEAASPAALSHKGDFIAALDEIEKESQRKRKKKRGIVARLKAAFSKWSGRGGSSSVSLSAPQNLVKRKRVGAGRLNRVDSSPEYRAAYRDAERKKAGKVRDSVRGDGILARAGEKAVNAFKSLLPGKLHGKEGPGAGLDGGEADGQPGATPDKIEKPEGAPTEEKPGDKESESSSGSGGQPSMGSPGGGISGGKGGDDKKPGTGRNFNTGVSPYGLNGDTKFEKAYADALVTAGSKSEPGNAEDKTPPSYSGDISGAQGDANKVKEVSQYKGAGINKAAQEGVDAPATPKAITKQTMPVPNLPPDKFPDGITDAQKMVAQSYLQYDKAQTAADVFRQNLQGMGEKVISESGKTETFSGKIVQAKNDLQAQNVNLNGLSTQLTTAAGEWQVATTMEASQPGSGKPLMETIQKASALNIKTYGDSAEALANRVSQLQKDAQSRSSDLNTFNGHVRKTLTEAEAKYKAAIGEYQTSLVQLGTSLQGARTNLAGETGGFTPFVEKADLAYKEMAANLVQHQSTFPKYSKGGQSVREAMNALNCVFNPDACK